MDDEPEREREEKKRKKREKELDRKEIKNHRRLVLQEEWTSHRRLNYYCWKEEGENESEREDNRSENRRERERKDEIDLSLSLLQ